MAKQTPRQNLSPLAKRYYERYVRFSEQLHNTWVFFEVQPELLQIVDTQCQDKTYESKIIFQGLSPVNPESRAQVRLNAGHLSGIVRRAVRKEIPELVLLNAISLFEAFIGDVAKVAYMNEPERFLLRENKDKDTDSNDTASEKENLKLLRILIKSPNREDAIERYIEEKLRGIFYGNPVDVFKKNRLGFNFHEQMANDCEKDLEIYSELVARRNVIVHNLGIVDQKYCREVPNPQFKAGDRVSIDGQYLYQALQTMNTLAKRFVVGVAYATTSQGLLKARMGKMPQANSKKKTAKSGMP